MLRRSVISVAGGAVLGAALPVIAQTQKALRRIGWLGTGAPDSSGHLLEAMRSALKALGWTEGQDIVIDVRWANGDVKRLDANAADLLALKPDLIIASSTAAAQAAQRVTRDIPIVFAVVNDPLGSGLVASWARPGGNVTGTATGAIEHAAKRLQLFKELVPSLLRVVALNDPSQSFSARNLDLIQLAAQQLGIRLSVEHASTEQELGMALDKISRDRPDGVFVMDSPLPLRHRKTVIARMAAARIPGSYPVDDYATDGGLLAYSVNYVERFQRAATYVDRILRGAKPGDLPVELPTKFELIINLKTARALGLTIPQVLLLRADRVIE